ncbi:MAG: hypothetical protein LBQ98_05995 [Nitrososphaerota archaeon]|nr:hypothetical protein [Nitrososphaerota archaeon]
MLTSGNSLPDSDCMLSLRKISDKIDNADCAKNQKTMALNVADSAYRLIYCCM